MRWRWWRRWRCSPRRHLLPRRRRRRRLLPPPPAAAAFSAASAIASAVSAASSPTVAASTIAACTPESVAATTEATAPAAAVSAATADAASVAAASARRAVVRPEITVRHLPRNDQRYRLLAVICEPIQLSAPRRLPGRQLPRDLPAFRMRLRVPIRGIRGAPPFPATRREASAGSQRVRYKMRRRRSRRNRPTLFPPAPPVRAPSRAASAAL